MEDLIEVGEDWYKRDHPDGFYIAWRSQCLGDEFRGKSPQEAVARLRQTYPECAAWRVFSQCR